MKHLRAFKRIKNNVFPLPYHLQIVLSPKKKNKIKSAGINSRTYKLVTNIFEGTFKNNLCGSQLLNVCYKIFIEINKKNLRHVEKKH